MTNPLKNKNMKAYSKYIALAAMAVSFAACQQEDYPQGVSDPDAVHISATIGNLPQTRVSYGDDGATTFTKDDAIYVQNTMRETKNAATYYTNDGMNWTIRNTGNVLVWNSGTDNNQFNAWYPAYFMIQNFNGFALNNQKDGVGDFDLMTASTEAMTKPEDGKLSLNFKHLLTKVTVTVTKWGTEIDEDDRYFTKAEIYTDTDITLDGTAIKATGTPNWVGACLTDDANGKKTIITAIICPGEPEVQGENWLQFTVGEDDPRNVKKPGITSFDAGKHYTFSLTVGKDKVEIGNVSVSDWTEESLDGGTATEQTEE